MHAHAESWNATRGSPGARRAKVRGNRLYKSKSTRDFFRPTHRSRTLPEPPIGLGYGLCSSRSLDYGADTQRIRIHFSKEKVLGVYRWNRQWFLGSKSLPTLWKDTIRTYVQQFKIFISVKKEFITIYDLKVLIYWNHLNLNYLQARTVQPRDFETELYYLPYWLQSKVTLISRRIFGNYICKKNSQWYNIFCSQLFLLFASECFYL